MAPSNSMDTVHSVHGVVLGYITLLSYKLPMNK